jgi:hypothetical protein
MIVPRCPFCGLPHYHLRWESHGIVPAHCRDNRRRDRADRRYELKDLRERLRVAIRSLLGSLGLSPRQVNVVMREGFEALLERSPGRG